MGLCKTSCMPAAKQRSRSTGFVLAVRAKIGMRVTMAGKCWRICRVTCVPSMSGMNMSIKATSNTCWSNKIKAWAPLPAVVMLALGQHFCNCNCATSRFTLLSSTTKMLSGSSAKKSSSKPPSGSISCASCKGMSNQKRAPRPSWLSIPMCPPCKVTNCSHKVKPKPVPPYARLVCTSACSKRLKICACRSRGMPRPESCTSKTKLSPCTITPTFTAPRSVNLMALSTRLFRI